MSKRVWPFIAGASAGVAGVLLAQALVPRRRLDPLLIRALHASSDVPPTVLVPGILGSRLLRPDGTEAWLNLANAFGHHDLSLPLRLPLDASRDSLVASGLLGIDTALPRVFGFTEYADLVRTLEEGGFHHGAKGAGPAYHVFAYDWRRDLVESARALGEALEGLAEAMGRPDARFNLVGHSMGGLVARYYLRYGGAEPEAAKRVSWAGARRVAGLILVATPSGGSIPSLGAVLNGERVGLSYTTLAAQVIARMPSIYQLFPPAGSRPLLDRRGQRLDADLHEVETWERFGWGPFRARRDKRRAADVDGAGDPAEERGFVEAVLGRAAAFHRALARAPESPCPSRVVALGGDCLPTLARAVVADVPGLPPRFEPVTRREAEWMFEAGDGRVTRASVLASHVPGAEESETGGLHEASQVFFGAADHHGIYEEPTFQSLLLRLLLRPPRERPASTALTAAR
jgi:pimeloyl-ACP methyl ester carboxylesterase